MLYFLTVNYHSTNLLTKLINSIKLTQNLPHQIVIINNSPQDSTINQFKPEATILEAGANLGYSRACNLGLNWIYQQNPQAIVWIINPDAYLTENPITTAPAFLQTHPELSILGTIISTPTGEIWFSGGRFIPQTGAILTQNLVTNTNAPYIPSDWVSGCSLIINLSKFPDCPQFNPAYFLYYEDFDFCQHYANLGHTIGITNHLSVNHQPSTITNRNIFLKIKHSTYSYLLTLEKYTTPLIFILRLTRLITHAILLLFLKPQAAFGKLCGLFLYLQRFQHPDASITH